MSRTFVIVTAMPPTTGHMAMIDFAINLGDPAVVAVHTQDPEPFQEERHSAVAWHVGGRALTLHLNRSTPEDPESPGFRDYWRDQFKGLGFKPGDTLVTSESYGLWLAEMLDGIFIPYDIDRQLNPAKATPIREDYVANFDTIAPEFQKHLIKRVTLFGAESVGKTTVSRTLARVRDGYWAFEYARPYLEAVGPEVTRDKMEAIWRGQMALQRSAMDWRGKAFVFQDTDLFSTLGYWRLPHWKDALGLPPKMLEVDAQVLKSDLYIILKSDSVPFEPDPLRYGGDHRESDDQYWIDLAEQYDLNYVYASPKDCMNITHEIIKGVQASIAYDRKGF